MLKEFKQLPEKYRAMILLVALSNTWVIVSSLFVNIYAFQIHNNISTVLLYNLWFFVSVMIGFVFFGWLFWRAQYNIKNMYILSYLLYISAVIFINIYSGVFWVLLYALLYGLGTGTFRCANHTQELANIENKYTDNYVSLVSSFWVLTKTITPLIIAIIFILAQYIDISGYTLLFSLFPFIYFLSFIFIRNIPDYRPVAIKKSDITHFLKFPFAYSYFIASSFFHSINFSIMAMISYYMLQNEITIGLYETGASVLSITAILFVKKYRNSKNRKAFLFVLSWIIIINYIVFISHFTLIWYIIFTIMHLFLWPLYRVSEHTYDLTLMDALKDTGRDFYPPMVIREFFLWIGRLWGIVLLYLLYKYSQTELQIMQSSLLLIVIFLTLSTGGIYLYHRYEEKK